MQLLKQGQRSIINANTLTIEFILNTNLIVDYVGFGLDTSGKLSDDRYMVFFNQPNTPCHSIKQIKPNKFSIQFSTLPNTIDRFIFTASIDGNGSMSELNSSYFIIENQYRCDFSGAIFSKEKAIMLLELYRKHGEWRVNCILQGFNDGLDALVKHFGGTVSEPTTIINESTKNKVSLEKKISQAAPQLLNLAKKAQISLEKYALTQTTAQVGLVLDASGSMNRQYRTGRVQEILNRVVPLAIHFDDDGSLDCWAFGSKPQQLNTVTLNNYTDFIQRDKQGWERWDLGSRTNNEVATIQMVMDFYKDNPQKIPVYIIFISDGGVSDSKRISQLLQQAAYLPIFWQFVGIGGRNYGILENLDEMKGRVIDNCNFFALDDLHDISEETLYEKLMQEFPIWLKEAKKKGFIN